MPSLRSLLAAGVIFGGLLYLLMLRRSNKQINFWHMAETGAAGALLLCALHLFGCAFYPENLVHVTDKDHRPIDPANYHFELGDLHFVEILAASMAFVGGSLTMFIKYLPRVTKEPSQQSTPHI